MNILAGVHCSKNKRINEKRQSVDRRPAISRSSTILNIINRFISENMPSWLSGLIQNKDETNTPTNIGTPTTHQNILSTDKMVDADVVQKTERVQNEIVEEKSDSILSLIRGKNGIQTTVLELIRELAKKKQDIQQAAMTLIQEQQNSDLLIKVTRK